MLQIPNVLAHFLRHGCGLLDNRIGEIADKWQLSASELQILLFLDQMPQLDTARDAAQYCGMSKASVSGNVLKLATRGLLTVDVDLKDRRFQHLALTDRAEPILWDARTTLQKFENQVLERISCTISSIMAMSVKLVTFPDSLKIVSSALRLSSLSSL